MKLVPESEFLLRCVQQMGVLCLITECNKMLHLCLCNTAFIHKLDSSGCEA